MSGYENLINRMCSCFLLAKETNRRWRMMKFRSRKCCKLRLLLNIQQTILVIVLVIFAMYVIFNVFVFELNWKHRFIKQGKDILYNAVRCIRNTTVIDRATKTTERAQNIRSAKWKHTYTEYFKKSRNVKEINCKDLFLKNEAELKKAQEIMNTVSRREISAKEYITVTDNCTNFLRQRGYIMNPLTEVEELFPLAYSLMVYTSLEQVERLLRAVYRPQNYYCIHIDSTADAEFQIALGKIARCLPNVHLSSKTINVTWGKMSVLQADLACMEDLWEIKDWKYYLNLAGEEFPLRTNYELVRILKGANGANFVTSQRKRRYQWRWRRAGIPPHNLTIIKGNLHVAVNRDFVDFALHNRISKDLLKWLTNTIVPDESFFSTLNHNPQLGIPGSYKGEPENDSVKPIITRFINWQYLDKWKCHGKILRELCVFGIGDLWTLQHRVEMFANKFQWNFEHFALDCMEELIFNRTRDEYLGITHFDSRFYEGLGTIKLKV